MSIITLSNTDFEVLINPELGGSVVAYNWLSHANGVINLLRDSRHATSVLDASNFPLVPFSNRIKNGAFVWQGKEYTIPLNFEPETGAIHGQGWQNSWNIEEHTQTSLIISFQSNEKDWPFRFIAYQSFRIDNDGLYHEISMKNLSNQTMPAGLGFHPYFPRTQRASLVTKVDQMWAVDHQCLPTQLTNIPEGLDQEGIIVNEVVLDNAFTKFNGLACINLPELKTSIELTSSENCQFAVIFTPKGENFFCVEPVTHCTDAINLTHNGIEDTGVISLQPNDVCSIWMKLKPTML